MYAIIHDGGRQYKVEEGQTLEVDYRNLSTGDELKLERVLAVNDGTATKFGGPLLAGAAVTAEVVGQVLGPKQAVERFRRRKNSHRRNGHRQLYTKIKINKIAIG